MAPPPISIPHFAETQLQLLQQEHDADVASSSLANTAASVSPSTRKALQATGYALTGIILSQARTGLGGRIVGEFGPDPAFSTGSKKGDKSGKDDGGGEGKLGTHGIRVGDVVRVNDTSGSGGKKEKGKDAGKGSGKGGKDDNSKGLEGVVTKVTEKGVWVAFGQRGGSRSKEEDEGIEELWGKKLWLYVFPHVLVFGAFLNSSIDFAELNLQTT